MFPCTKCGCCCKRLGKAIKEGIGFPYRAKENGECEMLEDNKCKVYDTRPDICNVDKVIELIGLDRNEYYKEGIYACNKMMDEDGISIEYRINY